MHPTKFALLLTLAAAGCVPTGNGPARSPASSPPLAADPVPSDSAQTEGTMDPNVEWHVSASDPTMLIFGTGDTLRMHAKQLRLFTQLTSPRGRPWFIFSGSDSGMSDETRNLYVVSPGMGTDHGVQHSWHMPGRLIDSTSGTPYYEASVFAGEVRRDTVGVIWYDRSLMPDGQWRMNTTLLRLDRPRPDTVVLFGQEGKSATIDLAMKGKCSSLPPIDQHTSSH
jgi:hypothetical protein